MRILVLSALLAACSHYPKVDPVEITPQEIETVESLTSPDVLAKLADPAPAVLVGEPIQFGEGDLVPYVHPVRLAGDEQEDGPQPQPTPVVYPRATIRHPRTACDGHPGIGTLVTQLPKVGEPFYVQWQSVPTTPPEPPDAVFVLLFSLRRVDPAPLPGKSGCWLMVHPDHVVVPSANGVLQQEGGTCWLNVTWPPATLGVDFFFQMLVADDVSGRNFRVSPMLWVTPGNQ